ncbi:MAG: hypothetical protein M3Z75_13555, partial [Actinomycetota bacterium]|nr:hypothetical protein [Actinomycetota bacterium]
DFFYRGLRASRAISANVRVSASTSPTSRSTYSLLLGKPQWLPSTAANLKNLDVPIPARFTRVPPPKN